MRKLVMQYSGVNSMRQIFVRVFVNGCLLDMPETIPFTEPSSVEFNGDDVLFQHGYLPGEHVPVSWTAPVRLDLAMSPIHIPGFGTLTIEDVETATTTEAPVISTGVEPTVIEPVATTTIPPVLPTPVLPTPVEQPAVVEPAAASTTAAPDILAASVAASEPVGEDGVPDNATSTEAATPSGDPATLADESPM